MMHIIIGLYVLIFSLAFLAWLITPMPVVELGVVFGVSALVFLGLIAFFVVDMWYLAREERSS